MGTAQSPRPSQGMGKSPGRAGAPRGPGLPWERFPGRHCYFGRVKQEGEGCRGKFNAPPAGPAPTQAGMKTIRQSFQRDERLPAEPAAPAAPGPAPGGARGDRTACPGTELRHRHPPALFPRILWLRDGVWGWIIPALAAAPVPQFPPGFGAQAPGLGSPGSPGKAQPSGEAVPGAEAACPGAPTVQPGLSTGRFLPPELSRLLTQHGTPVTPRGAGERSPSRRGCPGAAQRSPLCPPPGRVISSSPPREPPHPPRPWGISAPSHGDPRVPPFMGVFRSPFPQRPCPGFQLPSLPPGVFMVPTDRPQQAVGSLGVMPTMCCPRFPLGAGDP